MTDKFLPIFNRTIHREGGYKLYNVKHDRGAMTFAGISRRWHPDWTGWPLVDSGDRTSSRLKRLVLEFYRAEFWEKVHGDAIAKEGIAESIYDFAVNAGVRTSTRLAQLSVGAAADGVIGPQTLRKLNSVHPSSFASRFAMAKLKRYAAICDKDKSQAVFMHGWVNRTLNVARDTGK